MSAKRRESARISINLLSEFIVAGPSRQRQIIRDQKYKQDFLVVYYREANEAISQCLASNLENTQALDRTIASLEQLEPEKIGTQRRIDANIAALESFRTMLDDVKFGGAAPQLGAHNPPKLVFWGVEVSVRPEIVLTAQGRSGPLVGATKLYFSRTVPMTNEMAGYISAALQAYARDFLPELGTSNAALCPVIDVGSRRFHAGVRSIAQRLRDVEAACRNIADLWDSVREGE